MPNKHYLKGKAKEQRVKKKYQENGWIMLRMAGSKGFSDLVGIHKEKREVIFIQVKTGKSWTERMTEKVLEEYDWIKGTFETRFIFE